MKFLELKVPPVLLFALLAGGMYGLSWALPAWTFAFPGRSLAAAALALVGIAIALAGVAAFRRSRTTVHPHFPERASVVVTSGVFRWTRNPMYLGLLFVLAGWFCFLANAVALGALPVFVAWMNRFQIGPEERILSGKFGAPYGEYLASAHRWL